jgi:catechol 2,3-dioxygenase-like lactoylglutathione lyase family enzyme
MARIVAQSAVLLSRDVPAAIAHWVDVLGFSLDNTFGEPPTFAILTRDGAWIMIGASERAVQPMRAGRESLFDAYFWIDDAVTEFARQQAAGARVDYEPHRQPYGVLEFGVVTPDEHLIGFGQVLA